MLSIIDAYFAMQESEQKIFQLARRSGMATRPGDLELMPSEQLEKLARLAGSITDEAIWDRKMNDMISNYI